MLRGKGEGFSNIGSHEVFEEGQKKGYESSGGRRKGHRVHSRDRGDTQLIMKKNQKSEKILFGDVEKPGAGESLGS